MGVKGGQAPEGSERPPYKESGVWCGVWCVSLSKTTFYKGVV